MKRRKIGGLLCVACLLFLLGGCAAAEGGGEISSAAGTTGAQTTTSRTAPTRLPFSIRDLVTTDQIEALAGVSLSDPEVLESGTQLYFLSEDSQYSVQIDVSQTTYAAFDMMSGQFRDAVSVSDLGEGAWWSEEVQTLLSYGNGYLVGVTVDLPAEGETAPSDAAREIAALVLSTL